MTLAYSLELESDERELSRRLQALRAEDEWVNNQVNQALADFELQINNSFQPFTVESILRGSDETGEDTYMTVPVRLESWQDAIALSSGSDASLKAGTVILHDVPVINASKKSYEDELDIGLTALPNWWHYFTRGGTTSRKVLIPGSELQVKWTGEVFTNQWQIVLPGSFTLIDRKTLEEI